MPGLMKATEFLLQMEADRKLEKGEALTPEEEAVIAKWGRPFRKMCGCGCGTPLGPRVDGAHHSINGVEVCDDCYYDKCGKEVEDFPIGGLGVRRRGSGIR